MDEQGNNEFETEVLTVTIPGLANAIASGLASDLVWDDARDAAAHAAATESAYLQIARTEWS